MVDNLYLPSSRSLRFTFPPAGCPTNFPGYHIDKANEAQPAGCFLPSNGVDVLPAASLKDFTSTVDQKAWAKRGDAKDVIKKCGEEAVKNGAQYFGIKAFGECYYGDSPDLSQPEVTPADGCDTHCKWDVGASGAIFVFEVVPKTFKPGKAHLCDLKMKNGLLIKHFSITVS